MCAKIWTSLGLAVLVVVFVETSASATVVTTSVSFQPDNVAGASISGADNFELTLSVLNPTIKDSSGGDFKQDVSQTTVAGGTRFKWAEGATGKAVDNGKTTTLKVKFEKVFAGNPVTIRATSANWTEGAKKLNTVPFPGFQEVQLEKVGKDPLTELDLLNDGSSTLIVSDFSYAIVNGEIPLATFDFNPSGLSNFVGTLSVPPGGMTQVFQNVNIDDDQFLVFQGRLSDTSTFAVEQRLSLVPAPSSGWLLALGLLLIVGRVTYMRRSAMYPT